MKTKHLFFAAALPLAFAACTNEEFETMNGQTAIGNDQRPLVEVKLDFQKGDADTRVDYDGTKYSWEGTDTIGAFLMDEIASENRPFGATAEAWKGETWLEHYKLVDYIHTDYPFSWSTEEGKWVAPSKLQEGNYFFAAPYESYGGQRQMIHRIDGQTQTGGTIESMNAAIAKNQYFIGYAQIKAGTQNSEALGNVIMTPALAPVKVTLRNIGTLAKDVEKIIIRGDRVATALNVNPTNAQYNGTKADGSIDKDGSKYNLQQKITWIGENYFNYANLNGAKEDEYTLNSREYVYNIASGATDYSQADALRQTIHPSYSVANAKNAPEYERQAVLSFTSPVKVEANGGEIHFAVMVNTLEKIFIDRTDHSKSEKLTMDIITTQGQITNIDLTLAKEEEVGAAGGLDPNTVLLNKAITSLKSSVKNELIIQFDNNSVVKSSTKNIQDEDELLAFINWNAENTRLNTATLQRDVRFTKEMYDALHADGYKGRLAIKYIGGVDDKNKAKLLVDNDVPETILNDLDLKNTNVVVVLDGERELTKDIADKLKNGGLTIENIGTMAINEDVTTYVELNNYGTINIAESAKLNGTTNNNINNYGMVVNEGEFYNLNNKVDEGREAKGWVKTGKKNHFASNVADATIQLMNIEDEVTGSVSGGTIYFETAEGVKVSDLTSVKNKRDAGVTKLLVTGGTIDFDNCDNRSVNELTINGTVSVEGWNNATPRVSTYHKFTGVTEASINGNVTFTNAGIEGSSDVTFEAESALSFNKEVNFKDVTFIKGATVNVANGATVTVDNVTWNANNITNLGTFQYVTSSNGNCTVIAGNKIIKKPTAPVQPTEESFNVELVESVRAEGQEVGGARQFTTLKAMYNYMNEKDTKRSIKESITISRVIWLKETKDQDFYYVYLKNLAAGKEVILGDGLIGELKSSMGMAFGKLTMKNSKDTSKSYIKGDTNQPNVTILTVDEIDYTAGLLYISNGYIQLTGEAQIGAGSTKIRGNKDNYKSLDGGAIVTTNKDKTGGDDALLKWDAQNFKWVSL